MTEPSRPTHRRRRRAGSPQGEPPPRAREQPPSQPKTQGKKTKPRRPVGEHGDGGMRDLAGSGSSQVGISAALRARAVNRPTDEELAAAEREVVIVRRNWRPPQQP